MGKMWNVTLRVSDVRQRQQVAMKDKSSNIGSKNRENISFVLYL